MEISDKEIFVDSNYYIALFNEKDALHEKANFIAEQLEKDELPLVTSNFVFSEVVTVLSQRRGHGSAVATGEYLFENSAQRIVHIDPIVQETTWEIFKTVERKDVSFVDASIIATMRAENIQTLLTFDATHLKPLAKKYRIKLFVD